MHCALKALIPAARHGPWIKYQSHQVHWLLLKQSVSFFYKQYRDTKIQLKRPANNYSMPINSCYPWTGQYTLWTIIAHRQYPRQVGDEYIRLLHFYLPQPYPQNILYTKNDDYHIYTSNWHDDQKSSVNFCPLNSRQTVKHLNEVVCWPTCEYDQDKPLLREFRLSSVHTMFAICAQYRYVSCHI